VRRSFCAAHFGWAIEGAVNFAPISVSGELLMLGPVHRMTNMFADFGKIVAIFTAVIFSPLTAIADDDNRGIRLVTQNVDQGTTLSEVAAARTLAEFVAAVTTTYNNILATKPAERAAAMAREIAKLRPDLVALQEASVLRTGSGGPATTVQADLLQLLLDELAGLGHHYNAVAIVPGLDAQAPSTLGFDVRITAQDAILVRADKSNDLKVSNLQIEQFGVKLAVPSVVGTISDTRGWAAVDVEADGKSFRFVTTHLDSVSPAIRLAQANELLHTAADTNLPVVMAGDFNIPADTSVDPSFPAYQAMINAGFTDAWQSKRAPDPGFTCCQADNLSNPTSQLSHRIDLVLFRGAFGVTDISLIGNRQADRTISGLWPSDHAGVTAALRLPRHARNR
jgi:endonuclease/exonuclease/phosphatase family metal-dependent hydrolase